MYSILGKVAVSSVLVTRMSGPVSLSLVKSLLLLSSVVLGIFDTTFLAEFLLH